MAFAQMFTKVIHVQSRGGQNPPIQIESGRMVLREAIWEELTS